MENIQVHLNINGVDKTIESAPNRTLLQVLRDDLELTGVKNGCEEGECGACTVLIDGQATNSCLVLIGQAEGKRIKTIEGVAKNGELHPVQKAYMKMGAIQCGFCTPGFILSTISLLDRNSDPTGDEIRTALAGNLCRCTGYTKIIEAVQYAAKEIRNGN